MSARLSLQSGPLTWVKPEIDAALARAKAAFAVTAESPEDAGEFANAAVGLREVSGALTMIGMEGLARFVQEIEVLSAAVASQRRLATATNMELLVHSIGNVAQYLEDVVHGEPDQPMNLLPQLRELARAHGAEIDDKALFYPDLSLYPPPRPDGQPLADSALSAQFKLQRASYQRGMLSWLRNGAGGLAIMAGAIEEIEKAQPGPQQRRIWWVAGGFLDALSKASSPVSDEQKRLCARIERYVASASSATDTSADPLLRDLLYELRSCEPLTQRIRDIQGLFQLERHAAPSTILGLVELDVERVTPLLRSAHEALGAAKAAWTSYSVGDSTSLNSFRSQVSDFRSAVGELGNQPLRELAELIERVSSVLRAQSADRQELIAMEMATALLAAEHALNRFTTLTPQIEAKVEAIAARLLNALSGRPGDPDDRALSGLAAKNEDTELLTQVAREMHANLTHMEQVLDGFFRGRSTREQLAALEPFARHVIGALTMLNQETAAQLLEHCAQVIGMLADREHAPSQFEVNVLADGLGSLAFFVQALPQGAVNERSMVEKALQRFVSGDETQTRRAQPEPEPRTPRENLDFAPAEEPQEALEPTAAEYTPEESPTVRTKLRAEALPPAAQDAAPALATAAETDQASEPVQHGIDDRANADPEIVDIFLEEARGILAELADHLAVCREHPDDRDTLVTVRRAFHTLKGSGRMAGLPNLGEAAWTVESLLNHWLKLEQDVSPELLAYLNRAHSNFDTWATAMAQDGRVAVNWSRLDDEAATLRGGEMPQPVSNKSLPAIPPPTSAQPPEEPQAPGPGETTLVEIPPLAEQTLDFIAGHQPLPQEADAETPVAEEPRPVGTSEPVTPLIQIYLAEAGGCIRRLAEALAATETLTEPPFEAAVRAAHTLAGSSRTAGAPEIVDLAGALEQMLAIAREEDRVLSPTQREAASRAVDALRMQLDALSRGAPVEGYPAEAEALARAAHEVIGSSAVASAPSAGAERRVVRDDIDDELLRIFLVETDDLVPTLGEDLRQLRADAGDAPALASLRRALHTLKGSARMAGAMRLAELVHTMESAVEQAADSAGFTPATFDDLEERLDRLVVALDALKRPAGEATPAEPAAAASVQATAAAPTPAAAAPEPEAAVAERERFAEPEEAGVLSAQIRVAADTVDRLVNQAGEISIARGRIEVESRSFRQTLLELTDSVTRLRNQLREIEIHAEARLQSRLAQTQEADAAFDPLEFDRFTRFQELTRLMAESVHDVTTVQQQLLDGLDEVNSALSAQTHLNRQLQDDLMQLRTVPFRTVAERLHRVVRQTAREMEKRVAFDIVGSQVEIDRGVLERVIAPLEHLLRNAVAHGIEAPAHRAALGKAETGRITLTLRQDINDVVMVVEDDGRGLDYTSIRGKAEDLGWLAPRADVAESELAQLIFRPGFSTASEVTEVAGRGVGMDVVASELQALGGRVDLASETGRGAVFSLRVPLTLAVTKVLLLSAASRTWGVLTSMVEQVQEVGTQTLEGVLADSAVQWMGNRYPLHYLPHLLGLADAAPEVRSRNYLLLLRSGDGRVAVLVDAVQSNQDLVMKSLGPQLSRVPGIAGATVLPSGDVVLILNPVILGERRAAVITPKTPAPVEETATDPLIMVVDDSLTVRNVTGRLLMRNGFRVVTAKDGLDALQKLQDVTPAVMLVDIEMPRMDGFELTKHVRGDPRMSHTPIIMITSRLAQKHRDYAMELGVNLYLGKPYQEDELLSYIGGFTQERA
ncbi:MAG: Hpt domain-containing protein [Pseudomonadota bacterium]